MSARHLGGRELAARVRAEAVARLRVHQARGGGSPRIRALALGPNGGVRSYLEVQERAMTETGLTFRAEIVEERLTTAQARRRLEDLSGDPAVDGIILPWPLAPHLEAERVLEGLDPAKDVDALTSTCLGRLAVDAAARAPATAQAVMGVLAQAGTDLGRARVALIGAGRAVGLPTLLLLLHAGAAVTLAHRPGHDVAEAVRGADVVVAAAGSPALVTAADLRAGAVVVDVGTTEVDGRLVGDVGEGAEAVASAYAPVPGGVGPVTVAYLLLNALAVVGA